MSARVHPQPFNAQDLRGLSERLIVSHHQNNYGGAVKLLDVRRAGVFAPAPSMIPGARWCDPATVRTWAADLPPDQPVAVYCVYGHEVSQAAAVRLRAAGIDARYLKGGIDGWVKAGRSVVGAAQG